MAFREAVDHGGVKEQTASGVVNAMIRLTAGVCVCDHLTPITPPRRHHRSPR